MQDYSPALQTLWAKKARDGSLSWLPLTLHALDCAQVARRLWHHWLPRNVQMLVAQGLDLPENSSLLGTDPLEIGEQTFIFLAAVHDLGKATPAFQTKRASFHASSLLDEALLDDLSHVNLYLPRDRANPFPQAAQSPHALATEHLLRQNGCPRALAAIPGAHHGKPADGRMLTRQRIDDYPENYYVNANSKAAWQGVQNALLQDALRLAGIDQPESLPVPNMAAQILLSGLLIVADWISSNDRHYPLFEHGAPWQHLLNETELERRADTGWRSLNLPPYWQAQLPFGETEVLYAKRFSLEPGKTFRPTLMQQRAADIARGMVQPGILVIEAPMGKGKTEAALAAVEILAARTGSSGLFFALPTQATSDGIFPRIKTWAEALERGGANTIRLAHSKAQFNTDYRALMEGSRNIDPDGTDGLLVHTWFEGPKKSLLSDFVVGTIDQLLMAALKQKHVMLRHLGLAGKVVVIDECHAYDAYMSQYLERALNYLGAYGVPVVVLSATLPQKKRQAIIDAYLAGAEQAGMKAAQNETWRDSQAYPLITWTDGARVHAEAVDPSGASTQVLIDPLNDGNIEGFLKEALSGEGCVGIILNTVKKAQDVAQKLIACFGGETVRLLHSRFLAPDRAEKEQELLAELGRPRPGQERPFRIVVGTQVLEQSLDIDFDLLISDLCPMDLLLQRIGRLHRHDRQRPEKLRQARCMVLHPNDGMFDPGSVAVYGEYYLMRTKALLKDSVTLPGDIPLLVNAVYDESTEWPDQSDQYQTAEKAHQRMILDKKQRAGKFRLASLAERSRSGLMGWLDLAAGDSERAGEATVRDSDESLEVLVIQKRGDSFCFLPWQHGGAVLPHDQPLTKQQAIQLAQQRIRLPNALCRPYNIEETIIFLERLTNMFPLWQESPMIKGELILPLNENGSALINGYPLQYTKDFGLTSPQEVK